MYIRKAAKVATMHNPDVFIVGVNLVTVELPLQTVPMFGYWRKSWVNL